MLRQYRTDDFQTGRKPLISKDKNLSSVEVGLNAAHSPMMAHYPRMTFKGA
jgi:hypothetical protein